MHKELNAPKKPDGTNDGGPSGHRNPHEIRNQGVKQAEDTQDRDQDPEVGDELERFDTERGDAIQGKGKSSFSAGIWIPPRNARAGRNTRNRSDTRSGGDDAPQKEIDLLIVAQRLEGAAAHQPVIRVVIHHVHSKHFHHFVKPRAVERLKKLSVSRLFRTP